MVDGRCSTTDHALRGMQLAGLFPNAFPNLLAREDVVVDPLDVLLASVGAPKRVRNSPSSTPSSSELGCLVCSESNSAFAFKNATDVVVAGTVRSVRCKSAMSDELNDVGGPARQWHDVILLLMLQVQLGKEHVELQLIIDGLACRNQANEG